MFRMLCRFSPVTDSRSVCPRHSFRSWGWRIDCRRYFANGAGLSIAASHIDLIDDM